MEMEISALAIFPKEWSKRSPHFMHAYALKRTFPLGIALNKREFPGEDSSPMYS